MLLHISPKALLLPLNITINIIPDLTYKKHLLIFSSLNRSETHKQVDHSKRNHR